MYKTHFVRQGEPPLQLAQSIGFDTGEVWNDPKSEALEERRKNGSVLHSGDILFTPVTVLRRLAITAGATSRYMAKVQRLETRIAPDLVVTTGA